MASIADILSRINAQDFGRNDSTIVSSIRHPIKATGLAARWFQDQVNNAAGTGISYDEANPFYIPDSRRQEAAFNLAGMANLGSMPFATKSAGGTLGTVIMPKNLQKAAQQGFRTEEPLYHGTAALEDFDSFLPNIARSDGTRTGGKNSISLSTNPEIASGYATNGLSDEYFRKQGQYINPAGPRVLPVVTKGDLFDGSNSDHLKLALDYLKSKKSINNDKEYDFYKKALQSKDWGVVEHDLGKDFFKSNNFTGARVTEGGSENVIMFDPTAIRSRFAKFNKKDAKSANLLASVIGGTALANEYDKMKGAK